MQTFKNTILFYLLLTFSVIGCITSLQTQSSPTDITTATSGVMLTLSTPEATYTSKDRIPLELNIQNGKFDLLMPYANVSTSGAFAQLSVTDSAGNVVEPKHSITAPSSEEIFIKKDGKSIQCIRGLKVENAFGTLAWSPDGKALLYRKIVEGQRLLLKIDLNSRIETPLARFGPLNSNARNAGWDWFDPKILPVSPEPHLLTTAWAKVKTTN